MCRVRYSFTIPDTDIECIREFEKLKRQNRLTKVIKHLLEVYIASDDMRELIEDLDSRDAQIQDNALRDLIQNNSLYSRLGIRTSPEPEPEPAPQAQVQAQGMSIDIEMLESMIQQAIDKALKDKAIPASAAQPMDETVTEDSEDGESAGDDFDNLFGDFIM